MIRKKVLSRSDLENLKIKEENRIITLVNEELSKFYYSLLNNKIIGISTSKLNLNKKAVEFILKYYNESDLWVVEYTENKEDKENNLITFQLK